MSRSVRRILLVLGVPTGFAVAGVGIGMSGWPDGMQWALALTGVALAIGGIDALGHRFVGPGFDTMFWLAAAWLILVILGAAFADLLPIAEARNTSKSLTEPALARPDLLSRHPLGTDNQGLDILGGILYGARVSVQVGVMAVLLGLSVGCLIGVAAAHYRGWIDAFVGFLTDSMLAFPGLVLLLAIVSALDANTINLSVALAAVGVPTFIRLARANALAYSQREFVLAARAMGSTNWRIIRHELLPNVLRPMFAYAFLIVAVVIVAEASLSFLGVGIQRPTPTWGNMIAANQDNVERHPHAVFVPGGVLFLTVFAINQVGDRARKTWDAKEQTL